MIADSLEGQRSRSGIYLRGSKAKLGMGCPWQGQAQTAQLMPLGLEAVASGPAAVERWVSLLQPLSLLSLCSKKITKNMVTVNVPRRSLGGWGSGQETYFKPLEFTCANITYQKINT